MAILGALGDIVFEVSAETLRTLDDITWSGKARWATHQRRGNALTEFTGLDPDEFSFTMILSAYHGVNPMTELVKLWEYERKGLPQPLVIGDKAYGKFKWSVTDHSAKLKVFTPDGILSLAEVRVNLSEYLKD